MARVVPRVYAGLFAVLLFTGGCGRTKDAETPVVTPTVTLARSDAAIGMPLEMTYRFAVAPNAPAFMEDDTVFVHFLDRDGELMWTDDHQPPVPTRQWKPGQTIEYSRTMFVPKFPYSGEASIIVGLYSPRSGSRVPMSGQARGQREYQLATFNLHPQTENLYVVFKDGWHETEVAEDASGIEWQWSKKTATLAFRNPMRDVLLYFQCDQPVEALGAPQQVELRIGSAVIDSFALPAGQRELRMVNLTSAQLGNGETVEITVSVDRTFVPTNLTQLKSTDSRELGIRVSRAYVEPR
jgi:hypothetical protein